MVKASLTIVAAASTVLSVAAFQPVSNFVTTRQALQSPRTQPIFMADDGGVSFKNY